LGRVLGESGIPAELHNDRNSTLRAVPLREVERGTAARRIRCPAIGAAGGFALWVSLSLGVEARRQGSSQVVFKHRIATLTAGIPGALDNAVA
jgi:hypothetical protein